MSMPQPDHTQNHQPTMMNAALDLAAAGWHVFPCYESGPQNKSPRTSSGFKDATTDPDQIRQWWTKWPNALIAIAIPEGMTVFDVDPRNGGDLQGLEDLGVPLDTLTTVSGRGDGGCHKWTFAPKDFKPKAYNVTAGIDTRVGGKHYVIGAPSLHPDTGQPYQWVDTEAGVATLPAETIKRLQAPRQPQQVSQPTQAAHTATVTPISEIAELIQGPGYEHGPDDITPLDDFERRTDWQDILEPSGWRKNHTDGNVTYWTRPGKRDGISATTGHDPERDRLYVFSSSTEFEPETPYTKQGAYAVLHANGNHSQAASQLRKQGYGSKPKPAKRAQTSPNALLQDNSPEIGQPLDWDDADLTGLARMAARFVQHAKGQSLHIDGNGWAYWTGTHWAKDPNETRAYQHIRDVNRLSWAESFNDKQLQSDVKAANSAAGHDGVLRIASRDPSMFAAQVDTNAWLLNTPSGILNLHTLEQRPHDPTERITKISVGAYDPETDMTDWQQFLNDILPDKEIQAFLQRYAGLALIGEQREHVMLIATGTGRNGKGTFARTIGAALGDYAVTATNDLLVKDRQGNKGATEYAALMVLRGARWVDMSELDKGARINEPLMKQLTGGDPITTKAMGKNFVTFDPSHSFFMQTNDLPAMDADSTAAWSRVRVVPFDQSFYGREDPTLEDRLRRNLDAVLTWAVDGLRAYQQAGNKLNAPVAVHAKTNEWRNENDPVSRFVEDRCTTGPAQSVSNQAIRNAYQEWARANGENDCLTAKALSQALQNIPGVESGRTNSSRGFTGLGLRHDHVEEMTG